MGMSNNLSSNRNGCAMLKVSLLLVLVAIARPGFSATEAIDAALANPDRSEADIKMDAQRAPADVLSFFGIKTGMSVLDVFAGGGYYTEIMSHLVGPGGSVTLYNNNPWDRFVMKSVDERLKNNRLPNVERLTTLPEDLIDMNRQYDAAIFVLGMHDIYYVDEENQWPAIDREKFLGGLYKNLKDGGVLGIIDHNAAKGSDPAIVGKTLHRIDPAVIKKDLEKAGFTYQSRSYLFANAEDEHTVSVFAPEMRWKTDRSIMLFRK